METYPHLEQILIDITAFNLQFSVTCLIWHCSMGQAVMEVWLGWGVVGDPTIDGIYTTRDVCLAELIR